MTRAMELELEISDLEIKIENGNTDEQLLRELNEKRVLLAQKTRKTDRHRSRNVDFSQAEDKNTEGLFLCPAYYPVWKGKLKTKEK